jgi:hypothetical protein
LEAEILLEARLVRVEKFIVNFPFSQKTIFSRPIGAAVGRLSLSADEGLIATDFPGRRLFWFQYDLAEAINERRNFG